MHQVQPHTFSRGDLQMNTCLSTIYLKLNQIDSRTIRFALMTLSLVASFVILGVPMPGDVGI
jgi:multidrug transporter EmrE-like cation transporter